MRKNVNNCWSFYPGGGGGGGYSTFSSVGDDRRIFLGLKFSISGFFGGRKIWEVFVWVALFKQGLFGYSRQSEDS